MLEHLMEFIIKHWKDIVLFVVSYVLGLASFYFYMVIKVDKSSTRTKQSENIVMGDQAGRDIHKR